MHNESDPECHEISDSPPPPTGEPDILLEIGPQKSIPDGQRFGAPCPRPSAQSPKWPGSRTMQRSIRRRGSWARDHRAHTPRDPPAAKRLVGDALPLPIQPRMSVRILG